MREHEEIKGYLKACWEKNLFLKKFAWEEWERAYYKGKVIFSSWKDLSFFRINKEFKNFPVGTVFNETLFVKGYPSIPRIYVLKTGLLRYLTYPFYAEEKIEGYNVRLVRIGGNILAFTRRGYVCPFATDRWEDFLPKLPEFFTKYPELVVCCEVAGPENPFVSEWPPYIKEDIHFFVFDFAKRGTGEFLPGHKKIQLLRRFKLNHPEIFGPFHPERDYEKMRGLIQRYHREGREGLVFKPDAQGTRIKYVTPYSNLTDLKVVFPYLGEVDPNFITLRLIRLLMNLHEFEEFKEEIYETIGPNLFEDALRFIREKKVFDEVFRVKFKNSENYHALLAHFKQTRVNIEVIKQSWEKSYLVVEFKKIYPRATQFWRHKLEGWGEVD